MKCSEPKGKLVWEKPALETLGDLEALTAGGGPQVVSDGTTSSSPSM